MLVCQSWSNRRTDTLTLGGHRAPMPLCDTDIMEQLSKAYVRAIVARAGFRCMPPDPDRAGDDLVVDTCGPLTTGKTDPKLHLQLKATAKKVDKGKDFSIRIEKRLHNILRDEARFFPILLVVYLMPTAKTRWLTSDHAGLVARDCVYWVSLKGADEISSASTTVHVSRKNVLNVSTLQKIMRCIANDVEFGDAI